MSWPKTLTVPDEGVNCVAQIRTNVVLPAPFLPKSVNTLPDSTFSEMSDKASILDPLYFFVTPTASIASTLYHRDKSL
jgi:hypothetical protein